MPQRRPDGLEARQRRHVPSRHVVPQSAPNNQQTWEGLEEYCRQLATKGHELYIIAGTQGIGGTGDKGFRLRIDGGRISVPSLTWKVIMVLPRGEDDVHRVSTTTRLVAVIVPNTLGVGDSWTNYLHSVDDVEGITGLDFFSKVPQAIQDAIESQVDEIGASTAAEVPGDDAGDGDPPRPPADGPAPGPAATKVLLR